MNNIRFSSYIEYLSIVFRHKDKVIKRFFRSFSDSQLEIIGIFLDKELKRRGIKW